MVAEAVFFTLASVDNIYSLGCSLASASLDSHRDRARRAIRDSISINARHTRFAVDGGNVSAMLISGFGRGCAGYGHEAHK